MAERAVRSRVACRVLSAEDLLALQLRGIDVPAPEREYRFHDTRRWRFDFAWPATRVAVEVEGGVFGARNPRTGQMEVGRHSRGKGFTEDCIKYAEAACDGWTVLRVTTDMVRDGRALRYIERVFIARGITGSGAPAGEGEG